jgi:inosine-uridine nucleoside N-ribohydrolase
LITDIILDTDMGGDCDDVGALALLNVLANRGETRVLGVTHDTSLQYGPAAIDIINRFYGRETEIGVYKGADFLSGREYDKYATALYEKFGSKYGNRARATEAVALFRKLLAGAPGKVKLVGIGHHNNFAALLRSEPDGYSPLDGFGLTREKVDEVVLMAGLFGESDDWRGAEYNIKRDVASSRYFVGACPVPVTFIDFNIGNRVLTVKKLMDRAGDDNPVALAYRLWTGGEARSSWDLITVLYAVRGCRELFSGSGRGVVTVSEEGFTTFAPDPGGRHSYLSLRLPDGEVAEYIDELILSDRI